jgi:hypothetical protein
MCVEYFSAAQCDRLSQLLLARLQQCLASRVFALA